MDEDSVEDAGCSWSSLVTLGCYSKKDSQQDNSHSQKRISDKIDKQLKEEAEEYYATRRLFLVGTCESGKSTILNQLRIIHTSGFYDTEKRRKIKEIKNNIRDGITTILEAMSALSPPVQLEHRENQKRVDWIRKYANDPKFNYPSEFYEHIEVLWKDMGVQITYGRRYEYKLIDCAKYFLDRVNIINQPDYTPSKQDILRCYDFTEGINEVHFQMNNVNFYMVTIGRRTRDWSEIRFLMSRIFDMTGIIFVVASNSYDMVLKEDPSQNSLRESIYTFKRIWCNTFVRPTSIILFLNKQDLLSEKILAGKSKLEDHFEEFKTYQTPVAALSDPDESPEVTRAKYFIRDQFLKLTENSRSEECCFPHFTCAIDAEDMKRVFNNCQDIIQRMHLREYRKILVSLLPQL